jgi:hypothetical protein
MKMRIRNEGLNAMRFVKRVMCLSALAGFVCGTARAQNVLLDDDFESGTLESWTASSGTALYTYSGTGTDYSTSPTHAANLPKSGGKLTLTNPLLLHTKGYTNVTIRFYHKWINGTTTRFLNIQYAADGTTFATIGRVHSTRTSPCTITIREGVSGTTGSNYEAQPGYNGAAFTDTAKFRLSNDASATADVRAYGDDILITAIPNADFTPPTLTSIVDDQSGGAVYKGDVVTYTVTFSEDMDASTVDASDFGNAGTATLSVGAVTETAPGVFTAEATPTTVGTLQLHVNAGAVLKDVPGNALDTSSAILDDTTIMVKGKGTVIQFK